MAHFEPEEVSSLQIGNVMHVRLNCSRISAPNDSGGWGGKARWGGETLKWSKAYRLRFSCASALAHSFEQLFKEDCKLVYLCPPGTLEQ